MVIFKIKIKNFHITNEILNKHYKTKKFDYKLENHLMYQKQMYYNYKR